MVSIYLSCDLDTEKHMCCTTHQINSETLYLFALLLLLVCGLLAMTILSAPSWPGLDLMLLESRVRTTTTARTGSRATSCSNVPYSSNISKNIFFLNILSSCIFQLNSFNKLHTYTSCLSSCKIR